MLVGQDSCRCGNCTALPSHQLVNACKSPKGTVSRACRALCELLSIHSKLNRDSSISYAAYDRVLLLLARTLLGGAQKELYSMGTCFNFASG
jgi:hypothetical protein